MVPFRPPDFDLVAAEGGLEDRVVEITVGTAAKECAGVELDKTLRLEMLEVDMI